MSELKATPGPWSVGPPHVVRHQFQDAQDRRVTEWIAECVGQHPADEIHANAHLIAAAPSLYEALAGWVAYLDVQSTGSAVEEERLLIAMRAALAKARGESV